MTNQEAYEIMCDKVDKYDKMMCVLQELRREIEKKQTYKIFLDSPDLYIDRNSTLKIIDKYIKEYTNDPQD